MDEMKKLIIDGQEFEVVDAAGRQRITVLENTTPSGGGLSITEKNLILQLFGKAAYAANDAGSAYTALSNLWTGSYHSVSWEGTGYTHENSDVAVEDGESFTSTVTANNGKTIESVEVTMGGETVQGAYSGGTVTIPNVTGDIVITVTTAQMTVSSISAVYTQSGTVYDNASLDSLKPDLVVTGTFPDSSTAVIPAEDYTLSGTLLEGTSTITVSYGGKTASFNVSVTHADTSIYNWDFTQSLTDSKSGNVAVLNGNASRSSNGITLTKTAPDYVTFNTNIFGANRTYEVDIASLSMGSTSNFARLFMLKNGNYNNCGFLFCGQTSKGYSIYNGNGWKWVTSLDTDISKIQGKTLKIYIDSNYYWHVYIDETLILETSEVVNGAAGTNTSNNAITLGSSNTNSLDYNMVITGLRVYEGVV